MLAKDRIGRVQKIECASCGRTAHTIRGAYDTAWAERDMAGNAEHDLLSCNGCGDVTYRVNSWSTEDGENTTLYPIREQPKREKKDFLYLPDGSLESVYRQTIDAFNAGISTLTGAGVRLLIEGVCMDKGVKDGEVTDKAGNKRRKDNLEGKINGMVENGLISSDQANHLHLIRFLGNDAAHQLDVPLK
jgi:hypothetical protein